MKRNRAQRLLCKWLEKQSPIWYRRTLCARRSRLHLIEKNDLSGTSEKLLTEAQTGHARLYPIA